MRTKIVATVIYFALLGGLFGSLYLYGPAVIFVLLGVGVGGAFFIGLPMAAIWGTDVLDDDERLIAKEIAAEKNG